MGITRFERISFCFFFNQSIIGIFYLYLHSFKKQSKMKKYVLDLKVSSVERVNARNVLIA